METRKRYLTVCVSALSVILLTTGLGYGDLMDGLVGYWSFDNASDPGHDDSGTGNDGTVHGAIPTAGKLGNALWFDGIDDRVQVPGAPLNLGTSDVTLSAWIKANTLAQGGHGIIYKRDGSLHLSAGYCLGVNGDNQKANTEISPGNVHYASIYSTRTVTDGQWHLLTAVCDRDGYGQMYVDGVPDGAATLISSLSASMDNGYDLLIGQTIASFGAPGYFLGAIDDVRIYNRTLSSAEVSELSVIPAPAAVVLGGNGLAFSGWKLRRRRKL